MMEYRYDLRVPPLTQRATTMLLARNAGPSSAKKRKIKRKRKEKEALPPAALSPLPHRFRHSQSVRNVALVRAGGVRIHRSLLWRLLYLAGHPDSQGRLHRCGRPADFRLSRRFA